MDELPANDPAARASNKDAVDSKIDDLVPVLDDDIDADEENDAVEDDPTTIEEALAVARRMVRRALAWNAPLPPPEMLEDYEEAVAGSAHIIVADFEQRSHREAELLLHQAQMDAREFDLRDREQALRTEESRADIRARLIVLVGGLLFCLTLIAFAFIWSMWAPVQSDTWRVAGIAAFLAPIPILGAVLLLRGRMTEPERDIYQALVPKIMDHLQRHSATPSSQASADSQGDRT